MSTTEVRGHHANVGNAGMKLEVVVIPVSDVDRAKDFYVGLGWRPRRRLPQGRRPRGPVSLVSVLPVTDEEATT